MNVLTAQFIKLCTNKISNPSATWTNAFKIAHRKCNDMISGTMFHLTFPKQPLLSFAEVSENICKGYYSTLLFLNLVSV